MLRKPIFPYFILSAIILIEGFISISVEILTIRQVLPVVGSSVIVTSLIIGIFLLFLALGYQRGGRPSQSPISLLRKNFLIAAIWMGVGLSYSFIILFFYFIDQLTAANSFITLIIYLLAVTAPLIFILGQTVPITMNMANQDFSAGKIGGNVLGLSTIGSFLGSILTTLVLMYYFGVAWTIFFNFILLSGLTLLLSQNIKEGFYYFVILLFGGLLVYSLNVNTERNIFSLTNNYANYQILNSDNSRLRPDEKILMINNTYSSYINSERKGFEYIEIIKKILFKDLNLHNAKILVLGAGGFSLSAESTNDNQVIYVDIDPQLSKVVIPKFINKVQGVLINDDARRFVKSSHDQYNVIVVDVYSATKSIPSHLVTKEFMQELKQKLVADGALIINVIANPFMQDRYSKHVDNTIRSVFKNCMVVPYQYANRLTNIIYTCTNSINQNDEIVYTDNKNNSTIDAFYG